jgi:hypothetical protein
MISRTGDAATDELVAAVVEAVRETVRRETEDAVKKHTRALGNRIAAMLVNSGKDAHTAAQLCKILLEYDLEDTERVEVYWREAQEAASARYTRRDAGAGHGEE